MKEILFKTKANQLSNNANCLFFNSSSLFNGENISYFIITPLHLRVCFTDMVSNGTYYFKWEQNKQVKPF